MSRPRYTATGTGRYRTTRRFRLSQSEGATTALAVVASTALYARYGHPYLARGVLGDLLGLAALSSLAAIVRARAQHEAGLCLAVILLVLAAGPQWPLSVPNAILWAAVAVAVASYVRLRQVVCD